MSRTQNLGFQRFVLRFCLLRHLCNKRNNNASSSPVLRPTLVCYILHIAPFDGKCLEHKILAFNALSYVFVFYDIFVTKEITTLLLLACLHSSCVKLKRNNSALIFIICGNVIELIPDKINPDLEN